MKNATKPPKRKLLGFAEQLGSTPPAATPPDPSGVGLTKSPIPAGARSAAKAKKAGVASPSSEAPAPATVTAESPITAISKPAAPPPVKAAPPAAVVKSRSGGGPNKFVVIALVVVALVVAGPSLALLVGTFAYPLIVLAGIIGVWKLYDSSRSKGK